MRLGFSTANARWKDPQIYERLTYRARVASPVDRVKVTVRRIFYFLWHGVFVTNRGCVEAFKEHGKKLSSEDREKRYRILKKCFKREETRAKIKQIFMGLCWSSQEIFSPVASSPPTPSVASLAPTPIVPLSGVTIKEQLGGKVLAIEVSQKAINQHGLSVIVQAYPDLTSLSLAKTNVSDSDLQFLATLTDLTTLNLVWCERITDDGLAHLKELTGLTTLNLKGCKEITDRGLVHVKKLTDLTTLNLSW